jgi:hypothetical protein
MGGERAEKEGRKEEGKGKKERGERGERKILIPGFRDKYNIIYLAKGKVS